VGESGKGNGKVRVGDNVLPINLLPYLAEAYLETPQIEVLTPNTYRIIKVYPFDSHL
jgi:hypothetical protein